MLDVGLIARCTLSCGAFGAVLVRGSENTFRFCFAAPRTLSSLVMVRTLSSLVIIRTLSSLIIIRTLSSLVIIRTLSSFVIIRTLSSLVIIPFCFAAPRILSIFVIVALCFDSWLERHFHVHRQV